MVKLVYDGTFDCMDMPDNRQWTIKSDCVQPDGANYKGSSIIGLDRLMELGIVNARPAQAWARQCFRQIRKCQVARFK